MSEYAKGPWSIGRESWAEGHRDINSPDHGALAIVVWEMEDDKGHNDDLGGSAQCRANARLIAAAPELLEALELIMDCYESQGTLFEDQLAVGYDAIAKALGTDHGA